jgi:hypothetical protein
MKKILFVIALIAMAFACTQTGNKPAVVGTNHRETDIADYALPYDSAVRYAFIYDSIVTRVLQEPAPIRSYTIRSADLLEAMGLSRNLDTAFHFVRVHLGIDEYKNFRLFLNPVEGADLSSNPPKAGSDVKLYGPHKRSSAPKGKVEPGAYVLDFTSPCPATCPTNDEFFKPTSH